MTLLTLACLVVLQTEVAEQIQVRGDELIQSVLEDGGFPGVSAAVVDRGKVWTFVAGHADKEADRAMTPDDRLLSGSIGKTYVAAAVHHLVDAGELDFDQPASEFFEDDDWFFKIPNAADFTIRDCLRHQTGIPRHVFHPDFFPACAEDPDRVWKPEELLSYVFDADPLFEAGEGWSYADTNYIIVGMILERVAEVPFYDYVKKHLLAPHELGDTVPSDSRRIPKLTQGYIESPLFNSFSERSLVDGEFFLNPQFEWTGGGYASTASDLARWAYVLYRGDAFDGEYLESMFDGVEMRPGAPVKYGHAVFVRETPLGMAYGHDGTMTGFLATAYYYSDPDISAVVMLNTDNGRPLGRSLGQVAAQLAMMVVEEREVPVP